MREFPSPRRILAVLLVPIVLLGATAHGYTVFRCRYDGVARSSCCCPETAPLASESVISKGCCCDVDHVAVTAPTASTRTHGPRVTAPPIALRLVMAGSAIVPVEVNLPRAEARERSQGPPLILVKHSLLI